MQTQTKTKPVARTRHTPGPWARMNSTTSSFRLVGRNGQFIAGVEGIDLFRKEDVANAQLLAAAPELLEACKIAETWMKHAAKECTALTRAIARAEGKQP